MAPRLLARLQLDRRVSVPGTAAPPAEASARDLLQSRSPQLVGLLNGLSTREQHTLSHLLSKAPTNVYERVPEANHRVA
jgi:hypothetical protein